MYPSSSITGEKPPIVPVESAEFVRLNAPCLRVSLRKTVTMKFSRETDTRRTYVRTVSCIDA